MEKIDITIVGAGVVGLAVAQELAKKYKNIYIIEKNDSFGRETSSRNSEVIHAGIYYPKDSLKAKTCIEGNRLLYEYCRKNNIAHKKTGKFIVAISTGERKSLEDLFKRGFANGAGDLELLSGDEAKKLEPDIKAEAAISSPSTGILDSHSFMKSLASHFKSAGGEIVYDTEVIGIEKSKDGFEIAVKDKREGEFKFMTRVFINCAGLDSDKVAGMGGIKDDGYRLKYCKGDYFRVHNNKGRFIKRIIYPLPKEASGTLGIHATLDLQSGLRLGPDDEYVAEQDYNIDESKAKAFYDNVVRFLPFIELQDLAPDTAGIRPKLEGPGEGFRDFIIKEESDKGLKGFINLVGIESPGLTSSLSIAIMVKNIIGKIR